MGIIIGRFSHPRTPPRPGPSDLDPHLELGDRGVVLGWRGALGWSWPAIFAFAERRDCERETGVSGRSYRYPGEPLRAALASWSSPRQRVRQSLSMLAWVEQCREECVAGRRNARSRSPAAATARSAPVTDRPRRHGAPRGPCHGRPPSATAPGTTARRPRAASPFHRCASAG